MIDLNNHLFEQLEKLNDGDLEGYQLEKEIELILVIQNNTK